MDPFEELLTQPAFLVLLVIIFAAGIVRGFSGFGTGMIVGPVCAALFSPAAALITIFIMDLGPANILVFHAWKKVIWREVIPLCFGYALLLPAGLLFLKYGDPLLLRWAICLVVLSLVLLLWAGFQYKGPRTRNVSIAIGSVSGFLSGFAAIPGPPVILYWMTARTGHGIVRANLIMFFAVGELLSGAGLWLAGIFTWSYVAMGLLGCIPYLAGLFIGTVLFGHASEQTYRRIAFLLVFAAAILSMPALDGLFYG